MSDVNDPVPWTIRINCGCGETCEWWEEGNTNGCRGEVNPVEIQVGIEDEPDHAWMHYCDTHDPEK